MTANNIVLIPNDKLTKTTIINYHLSDKELSTSIELNVDYSSDLDKAERAAMDVARDVVKNVPGGVITFDPIVRFNSFSDSNIKMTVIVRAKEFADQFVLKHELIKRIHRKFKDENIIIPSPIRTVRIENK